MGSRGLGAVREPTPPGATPPRLLDRVRAALRTRHYSRRTEEAYVAWIKRYILFHAKRHPSEMGAREITAFLSALAVEGHVAASTQNQALSALLFLYRDILEVDLPWLDDIVRAKRPVRLPVVLTRDEVRALLQRLGGAPRLMARLLYGAGLRVLECCRLRAQDQTDVAAGPGWVVLPTALLRKCPNAGSECGSRSSPAPVSVATAPPVSSAATMSTRPSCSVPSGWPTARPVSPSGQPSHPAPFLRYPSPRG